MSPRVARKLFTAILGRLKEGRIEVVERGRSRSFGPDSAPLRTTVTIHHPDAWAGLLSGGRGLGETFVDGLWETDYLVSLIRIAARELRALDGVRGLIARPRGWAHRVGGLVPANTRTNARDAISSHYDLGNDLFSAFLDERMLYSCAFYSDDQQSLEDAQTAKLERLCAQLRLSPEDHLLEIGTGWGAMAIHAAREHGCQVTTTTISREQREMALERIAEAGLSDRITVLLEDYRDLTGTYDKLVSVEMIEAVGWQYFHRFFECCSDLLEPDGLMVLQAITIDDRLYQAEKAARSFANTHVFPGGCLPSQAVISENVALATDMRSVWMEDITAHYPPTLAAWRKRFDDAWPELSGNGYDERFRRLWIFYLCFVEAGFIERRICDVQMLFAKPSWRGDDIPTGIQSSTPTSPTLQPA